MKTSTIIYNSFKSKVRRELKEFINKFCDDLATIQRVGAYAQDGKFLGTSKFHFKSVSFCKIDHEIILFGNAQIKTRYEGENYYLVFSSKEKIIIATSMMKAYYRKGDIINVDNCLYQF